MPSSAHSLPPFFAPSGAGHNPFSHTNAAASQYNPWPTPFESMAAIDGCKPTVASAATGGYATMYSQLPFFAGE